MSALAWGTDVTFTATTQPILGVYMANGAFPTPGPSAWPSGPTTNMTGAYFAFPEATWSEYIGPFVSECIANSLTPFIELEPWNFDQSAVPFSSITGGSYDSQLEAIGAGIAAAAVPVMITFAHEFNVSGQYPWAQNANATLGSGKGSGTSGADLTPSQWIAGWTYVKNKINAYAGGYALWMWACSAYTGGTTISPASYWPSSALPSMVGIDGYPSTEYGSSLGTFSGQLGPTVTIIRGLGWSGGIFISETNLAQMANGGTDGSVTFGPGQSITAFVNAMYAAGVTGVFEFEEYYEQDMTSAQWTEYLAAITANYGGGGGGGSGGTVTYTQTLYDGFSGSSVNSSLWVEPVNTNGISVSGGTLKIQGLTNYEQVMVETSFNHNLADGIFALQLSQSGAGVNGTMWFLGICDNYVSSGGNAYEFQTFPAGGSGGGAGSWYTYAFSGTDVSGDTGAQNILSPSVWSNGNWLGIGNFNLNGENDVHVYKSSDAVTWTEIASFTVTGAINESACGFYFGTNYDDGTTGTSTYLATIDNVSWFARGESSGGGPSSGAGTGGLVQWASNETTGSSLTLTLPNAITPGNTVALALSGYILGSITEITIGGTPVTFTKDATSGGYNAEIWAAESVTEASATIVVTASTPGIIGYAYEMTGNRAVSVDVGTYGNGASPSSGSTAESPAAAQVVIGIAMCIDDSGSVTGPSSGGWVNLPSYAAVESGSGGTTGTVGAVSGWMNSSGSAEYDYSGTLGTSGYWGAVTAAFKVASSSASKLLMVGIA